MALSLVTCFPLFSYISEEPEPEQLPPVEERTESVWLDRLFWVAAAGALIGATLLGGFLLANSVTADLQDMVADISGQIEGLTETLDALPEQAADLVEPLGETIEEAVRAGTADIFPWSRWSLDMSGGPRYTL